MGPTRPSGAPFLVLEGALEVGLTLSSIPFPGTLSLNAVVTPPRPTGPATRDDCRTGGWATFTSPSFSNQGRYVSWVNAVERAGER